LWLTHSSTAKQEEKQEERGSCQTLAVSIDDIIINSSVIIFTRVRYLNIIAKSNENLGFYFLTFQRF